jgi:hypothetical protein
MEITCDLCGKELDKPGALLFSPPGERQACFKIHICYECYWRDLIPFTIKMQKENSE